MGPHHKFYVPALTSFLWVYIVIPYLVAIPLVSAVIDHDSDDYETFVKVAFTAAAGLFMLAVSTFAIIINVFLQVLFERF